jgi:hypothetical protein
MIEPIFERTFIQDSYACRRDKGTHRAVERFTQFCRANRYCLKADIRKYFPSIDHGILLEKIGKKIKCPDTLWLVRTILERSNEQEEANEYFSGDDLFTPFGRRKGIPIGNLTSQFFANCYLNDLDHYVKEELRCRSYLRYVDDLTIFANEKRWLWEIKKRMEEFLARDRLKLHPRKTFVAPVAIGLDYLGYRIFPTHRRLRKDTSMRFLRRLRGMVRLWKQGLISWEKLNASVQSWLGHAQYADTHGLIRSLWEKIETEGHDLSRRLIPQSI